MFSDFMDIKERDQIAAPISFDFNDGRGEVLARQHWNAVRGQWGGWVEDTAEVHPDAIIEEGAIVTHQARVGKNTVVLSGAIIKDEAFVGGPLIIGKSVTFNKFARCTIPNRIRHPIFIGLPRLMQATMIINNGHVYRPQPGDGPQIMCSKHPIVNRLPMRKGTIREVIFTDDKVLLVQRKRGYKKIKDYVADDYIQSCRIGPLDQTYKSWDPRGIFVDMYQAQNIVGQEPDILHCLMQQLWPEEDLKRVGGMPTTVARSELFMKH